MAQDKITVFFEPKGDKALVKAINSLARAQKRLGTQTDKTTRTQVRNTKATNKQTKGLKLLGGTLSVVRSRLLVYAFAAKLVNDTIGKFVRLAMKQQDVEKKLEVQLGFTSQALLDYATAQQKVTQFGDEEVISVMGQISAFTKNEEQIKALTQATLDLAEGQGMQLNDAAMLVGKTFGSTTNSMSRYGVAVKGAMGSQKRLESLTENVADKYGDLSKNIDTTSKAVKQMGNAVGDAGEELGKPLLEPLKNLAISMTNFVQNTLTPFIKKMNLIDFKQTFSNIINNGQAMVDFFIRILAILPKAMIVAGKAMWSAFKENFIKPLVTFFGSMTTELADLLFYNFQLLGLEAAKGILEGFSRALDGLTDFLGFGEVFTVKFGPQLKIINEMITDGQKAISDNRLFKIFKEQFEADIFDIDSIVKEFGEAYRDTIGQLVAWQEEQVKESGQGKAEGSWFTRIFSPTEKDIEAIKAVQAEWQQFQTAIMGVANAYETMKNQGIENARQTELAAAEGIRWEKKRTAEIDRINQKYDLQAKKQKEEMRDIKVAEAISNTALGITKAYTSPGGIPGWILAGLIAVQGAMQVATIKAQKYEYGGLVGGRRHSQGGTMIEAERGEFVMSRGAVNAIGVETMNRINQGGGAGNINISFNGNILSKDFIEEEAIPQIKEAIRRGADIGVG